MADFIKKARKSNFSPEEIEALVTTVGKHYHVLYGEYAKRASNKQARHRVWLEVMRQVNRVSLERRTLQEIKNKWKKCQHMYKEQESPDDFVAPNVWEPLTGLKDSMPLEQRLKAPSEQEPVLQSQPLSPTKLKVTRQSAKPPQVSPKPPTPEPPNEEVCLRWNSHHVNMQSSFPNLLLKEQYVDATLVAEGQSLKCHRLILSSCSPYFEEVLSGISPFQHPVLFMKDIPFWVLKSLCDFMYAGEVHIFQNKLEELLAVAESLKIKGLAGNTDGANDEVKATESTKTVKDEKKEEKEVREVKERKRSSYHSEITPKTSSRAVRSVYPSKKTEKASLSKEGILDPLDLLEPVYEEVTNEPAPVKVKEIKNIPVKRGKLKKRKISEEREESPPPLFLSRKGTRSRPNVKIPKYFHTHYERLPESTIVREPHTNQSDPLMQPEEIKLEPLDPDNVIEIEDNVIGYSEAPDEEIIGNYDSPLFTLNQNNDKVGKGEEHADFRKINLIPQPIIMNIHSIAEKPTNTLQIVDVAQLKNTAEMLEKTDDPLATVSDNESGKIVEDPLNLVGETLEKSTEGITITNVQSMADMEESQEKMEDTSVAVADAMETEINFVENEEKTEEEPLVTEDRSVGVIEEAESAVNRVECGQKGEEPMVVEDASVGVSNDAQNEVGIAEREETEQIVCDKDCVNVELVESVERDTGNDRPTDENRMGDIENNDKTDVSHDIPVPESHDDSTNRESDIPEEKLTNNCEDVADSTTYQLDFDTTKFPNDPPMRDETVKLSDCASELGFQITNVVSGSEIEELEQNVVTETSISDPASGGSDTGTFSNHLSEIESAVKDVMAEPSPTSESVCEDSQFLAESLEKLLEK